MAGFSNITGDESILFADNVSFDGTERGGKVTTNGQLLIGSTVSPHIRVNQPSNGNNISWTFGSGTIRPDVTGTTNNAVQIGNSNGSLTSVAVGTNGQVLIGATGAAPAFATITSNDGTIAFVTGANSLDLSAATNLASNIFIFDDFIGTDTSSGANKVDGQLSWYNDNAATWNAGAAIKEAGHPGIIGNQVNSDTGLFLGNFNTAVNPGIILGGGTVTLTWIFKIQTLSSASPRYIFRIGLGDTLIATGDQANGCYFEYSDNINSGNWVIKTANASTRTTTNSATAVTAAWHKAVITVNAAASSVSFTMDGASLGSIATNIPTAAITVFMALDQTVGAVAASSVRLDLMSLNIALTTPR